MSGPSRQAREHAALEFGPVDFEVGPDAFLPDSDAAVDASDPGPTTRWPRPVRAAAWIAVPAAVAALVAAGPGGRRTSADPERSVPSVPAAPSPTATTAASALPPYLEGASDVDAAATVRACPSGDECQLVVQVPAAVRVVLAATFPSVQVRSAQSVLRVARSGRTDVAYRQVRANSAGTELLVTVQPRQDADRPGFAETTLTGGRAAESLRLFNGGNTVTVQALTPPGRQQPSEISLWSVALDDRVLVP